MYSCHISRTRGPASQYHTWHFVRVTAVGGENCQLMMSRVKTLRWHKNASGNTHSHTDTHTQIHGHPNLGVIRYSLQCEPRSLLTARSSSSELKRLSRSLMDTTRSVSWIRLVEAMRLEAAARWASARTNILAVNTKISLFLLLVHMMSYDCLCKLATLTGFNLLCIQPIHERDFLPNSITETLVAWRIGCTRFKWKITEKGWSLLCEWV